MIRARLVVRWVTTCEALVLNVLLLLLFIYILNSTYLYLVFIFNNHFKSLLETIITNVYFSLDSKNNHIDNAYIKSSCVVSYHSIKTRFLKDCIRIDCK